MPTATPDWSQAVPLPLAIANAISRVEDADRRPQLWENLVFTGHPAKIKTIQIEAISSLSEFVATEQTEAAQVLAEPNPLQARNVRALRVPDYFSEFKDRTDLAPFLGGTIYAKLVFGDPQAKAFITKQNYNEAGPNQAFSVKLTTTSRRPPAESSALPAMALNAADALFMDELFADLDASHFSIPPSQSPPKPKPIRLQGSQTSKVQNLGPSRPRAVLAETTRFQSQPALDLDLEDWFQQPAPPTPKLASRHSQSAVKRQKLDRGIEATTSTGASASKRPRQPREQCTFVRCRVVATVHGSYNVASDTHSGPARTRPEHLLVLEKDQLDSRSKRADGVRPQNAQQADVYLASLRDDWMQTIVGTGDIVHLVGRFESDLRKVPILLEQQSSTSASNKSRSAPHPAIEIALEEPAADSTPPPDVRAESVESDDELWDDLASMPSLSQCATQEMLASDDAPRAQIMIFASRSTDADSADNAPDNLLVVHPDVLVPATKVADVASCIRKPVVQDRLRGASDTTISLVMGNMLHELLQACLTAPPPPTSQTFPPPKIEDGDSMPTAEVKAVSPWPERWQVPKRPLLNSARKQLPSLALRMSFYNTMTKLLSTPRPIFANKAVALGRLPAKVRIRRILDVEEEIWSPAFGLKGKVDVSVECDIADGSDAKPSRKVGSNSNGAFARGVQKQDSEAPPASKVTASVVPLELKTGRAEVVSTEHRAQTMLYTLMMSDRYATRVSDGLLYYSKSGEMHRISRKPQRGSQPHHRTQRAGSLPASQPESARQARPRGDADRSRPNPATHHRQRVQVSQVLRRRRVHAVPPRHRERRRAEGGVEYVKRRRLETRRRGGTGHGPGLGEEDTDCGCVRAEDFASDARASRLFPQVGPAPQSRGGGRRANTQRDVDHVGRAARKGWAMLCQHAPGPRRLAAR
ncbi:hypothetical protein L1887_44555 [Cichorium endivia]|nr:hypothetical protein L1887_44555 [Cichorium endivia]